MRKIFIDLSSDNYLQQPKIFGGYEGEHNETYLQVKLPKRMIGIECSGYRFDFQTSEYNKISSPLIPVSELKDDTLSFRLSEQLTIAGKLLFNISAILSNKNDVSLIAKTNTVVLLIENSPNGRVQLFNPNSYKDELQKMVDGRIEEYLEGVSFVGEETEEGGEIFNDYETNKARTPFSSSKGSNNIAGGKGFKILSMLKDDTLTAVGRSKCKMQLSTVEGLELGDVISANIGNNYTNYAKIVNINESDNLIYVNVYPVDCTFTEGKAFLWVSKKQNIGDTPIGENQSSEGVDNTSIQEATHSEGRGNISSGKYSHTENRGNEAGYAAHAQNLNTKALANGSSSGGSRTEAHGMYSDVGGEDGKTMAYTTFVRGLANTAGTNAFEIKGIDFKKLPDKEEEEPTGQVVSYYVKANESEEQDGSQEYPFNTIAQAIASGITAGLTEGDTLIVNLLGDITWVDGATHPFKVIVQSVDDIQKKITFTSNSAFKGDMDFKNIVLVGSIGLRFGINNITLDKNSVLGVWYVDYGTPNMDNESAGQSIIFNDISSSYEIMLINSYGSTVYNGDVTTIVENIAGDSVKFYIGDTNNAKVTYKKNINFDIRNANKINLLIDNYNKGLKLEGALQIINSSIVPLTCETGTLSKIPSEQKWILTNKSSCKDALSFTAEAGKFAVKEGYTATTHNRFGDEITSANGILDLTGDDEGAGEYTVDVREEITYEGTISLSSVEGLENGMLISIKSTTNQDFILNAGNITAVDTQNDTIKVMGYPSQINRFLSTGKKYLFVLADCMLGDYTLGDCSSANGIRTKTIGKGAHTGGEGTIATADNQYVCGTYNANKPNTIFELGCGTSDAERRNAFEVYKDGTIGIYGTKITRERLRKLLELIN